MKVTNPKAERYIAAVDRVVKDIAGAAHLPNEILEQVAVLRLEMGRRPEKLPEFARIVKGILNGSAPPMTKCNDIIMQVSMAAGKTAFEAGTYQGFLSARAARYPDLFQKLPAILERGRVEINRLV